jgi:hypothetical protein
MEQDRRRHPRTAVHGEAELVLEDSSKVSGDVIEISHGGFRLRHEYRGFKEDQRVSFVHAFDKGKARVVWSRQVGPHMESGFCILDRP